METMYNKEDLFVIAAKAWYEGKKRAYEANGEKYIPFDEWLKCNNFTDWFDDYVRNFDKAKAIIKEQILKQIKYYPATLDQCIKQHKNR